MNNTSYFYMALYGIVLIVAFLGAYFKIVSPDVLTAALGIAIGHGTGLFTPVPITGKVINGQSV